ncbi:MAG: HflK protein [Legionellales bacterium RIFCSPHIGHO2_12_FULL_37_14]|nr:MAG: HflK protein [Legionellales bacterium RIFCSPHIGHO2_12_FULL_37_14]
MGWNDNNKKDPWNGKNDGPPDLDAALKAFINKFKNLGGKTHRRSKNGNNKQLPENSAGFFVALFFGLVIFFWLLFGIFIVDPAEQAVILKFGRYVKTVGPGPHWIPRIFYSKNIYNVDRVSDYSYSAQMLTKDENLVSVSLVVQYRIADLKEFLFNATFPIESLQQATSSALRQVVGTTTLDQMITEGREAWGASVQETLIDILHQYKTGIKVINVSPQPARAPENVQDAFDDAIKAQEDERRFKEQAYAYKASVIPIANGNANKIVQEAEAYSKQVVLQAKGDVAEFLAILPEYLKNPEVTSERLYLDTLQSVLSKSTKLIIDTKPGSLVYVPLDKLNLAETSYLPTPLTSATSHPTSQNNSDNNTASTEDNRQAERSSTRPTVRED